ncbi:MAG TPA: AMP-binding protein, partial [Clostridiaceae bacterium]|nr:AMP-binding protein [Clostridiaceae bacterium]
MNSSVEIKKNPYFEYYDVAKITSIKDMMQQAVAAVGDKHAFRYKVDDVLHEVTYREFDRQIAALGSFIVSLGEEKGHIACIGKNRYEWLVTYLMALQSAGVFVPLDRDLPEKEFIYLLQESDTTVVFYEKDREESLKKHREELPKIRYFIGFDRETSEGEFLSYEECMKKGSEMDDTAYRSLESDPHALKDLVYTSGTTGSAKGVMLSEHNLVSSIYYGLMVSTVFTRSLSVLPYHHTYAGVPEILVSLHKHATICINDSLMRVLKNLQFYKPDYIYLVPAFAELFYNKITKTVAAQNKTKGFNALIKIARALRKIGIDLRRVFFKQIHQTFGGNMRKLVCGGAPIPSHIGQFFDDLGFSLIGGYGITECSPLVCV